MSRASVPRPAARTANLLAAFAVAAADQVHARTTSATGLPASDTAALVALTTFLGGASQDELAAVLELSQSGVVRLVDRLARQGLLGRHPGPDGRTSAIVVAPAGRAAATQALEQRAAAAEHLLSALDADERESLSALLGKLLAGMTGSRPRARRICRLCDPHACGHDTGHCPVTQAADALAARVGAKGSGG